MFKAFASALLLILSLSTSFALAAEPTTLDALKSSKWQGTFEVLGDQASIKIMFLGNLDASGRLPYFSKVDDSHSALSIKPILNLDKSCPFTPRALLLNENSSGKISIYACTQTAAQEQALEHDSSRPAKLSVTVQSLTLSPDERELDILVMVGPIQVKYHLTRQP